ncbi:MAG TPA: hypothetical protein VNH18_15005 [Bryobacteraceae bacterium]|nr:hypothetical protein [Bryobacteraceae bacterium]
MIISAIEAAAFAFTAWRLFARGLTQRQAGLTLFLLFRCLFSVIAAALPPSSQLYFWTYVSMVLLYSLISIGAVRESLALVLDDYPGIRSLGRWTMYGALIVGLISSLAIGAAFWRGSQFHTNLYSIQVVNRSVTFSLAIVVASLLIFLSHYPLDLSRNRLVSSVAFGALFLSEALTVFVDTMAPHLRMPRVDQLGSLFGSGCLIVWGLLLQHEEPAPRPPRPPRPREEHLLRQLRALDRIASKVGHG